jgi:hypothetical protein
MLIAALAAALAAGQPATAQDLAWMVGDRHQKGPTSTVEETWIDGGDVLLGVSATVKAGRTVEYEHLRITTDKDGRLAYFAEPSGQTPAAFWLKSYDGNKVVFENPAHDFPQRIIYWKLPGGAVGARIEGLVAGQARGKEWTFTPH